LRAQPPLRTALRTATTVRHLFLFCFFHDATMTQLGTIC
jgi:hypothetical protein